MTAPFVTFNGCWQAMEPTREFSEHMGDKVARYTLTTTDDGQTVAILHCIDHTLFQVKLPPAFFLRTPLRPFPFFVLVLLRP